MAEKSKTILKNVGEELKANPPRILAKTKKKFGAKKAEKQRVAILLSKARQRGAHVPPPPTRQEVISKIKERGQNA